ncbi:SNF2-related protein [Desulfohalobium retbaense DSM 5692]|uniref:SNF2-related protein n=2 Tax=Desulfohalobium TaxID=45662 RepID=C8WZW0_DESRD|nr:SNF2-related protein [Desulfohalobium retbaense DSM 5692]
MVKGKHMPAESKNVWQKQLSEYFRKHIRNRGNTYFREGRVRLRQATATSVKGTVDGGQSYTVHLIAEEDGFRVYCSCPYFSQGGACKHLWAAIRAADAKLAERAAASRSKRDPQSQYTSWRQVWGEEENTASSQCVPMPGEFCPFYGLERFSQRWYLQVWQRYICKDGSIGRRQSNITYRLLEKGLLSEPDRRIIQWMFESGASFLLSARALGAEQLSYLLPLLAKTERCAIYHNDSCVVEQFKLGRPMTAAARYQGKLVGKEQDLFLSRVLVLGEQEVAPDNVAVFFPTEPFFVIHNSRLYALREEVGTDIQAVQANQPIQVPRAELPQFLETVARAGELESFSLPQEIAPERIAPEHIRPCLTLVPQREALLGLVSFYYGDREVAAHSGIRNVFDAQHWAYIERDDTVEASAWSALQAQGFEHTGEDGVRRAWEENMAEALHTLRQQGWLLQAQNKQRVKTGSVSNVQITSGQDWFDLSADVDFEGQELMDLPAVLQAYKDRQRFVVLDDGSLGMLPEKWLADNGLALQLGRTATRKEAAEDNPSKDALRFTTGQGVLLDSVAQTTDHVREDEQFSRYREKLHDFKGLRSVTPPQGLQATLREYQQQGLSWLAFLEEFGLGGILADDMGLGKTIQVLAHLLQAKERGASGQALVVAPTSLALNWASEARRFTPELAVHLHTGPQRFACEEAWETADVVVTTYGLLRQDTVFLAQREFAHLILDESQAIKNAQTQTAQCARQLQARHRLCLTGTPLENHAGELWSQMEFLNPGLLGSLKTFEEVWSEAQQSNTPEKWQQLHRFLRPFLLRRTKEEVMADLPEKMEQVVSCSMTPQQAKLYSEIRDHYRAQVLSRVEEKGLAQSKMHVLEGLLRLRQVACHPKLVGGNGQYESGKLQELRERITAVVGSGHKALVFSQFTRFLRLIKDMLESEGIAYCSLDGRTPAKRRQERVARFQDVDGPPVFTISLKAGGTGLNLTAADYVFIADPWWNPAVEMQAVDRTHRIGQDKTVFTYRFVTEGTVEEKIRTLQNQKQELVQSVLSGSKGVLKELSREDLEVLLS